MQKKTGYSSNSVEQKRAVLNLLKNQTLIKNILEQQQNMINIFSKFKNKTKQTEQLIAVNHILFRIHKKMIMVQSDQEHFIMILE